MLAAAELVELQVPQLVVPVAVELDLMEYQVFKEKAKMVKLILAEVLVVDLTISTLVYLKLLVVQELLS
jgi:hypothetical protein